MFCLPIAMAVAAAAMMSTVVIIRAVDIVGANPVIGAAAIGANPIIGTFTAIEALALTRAVAKATLVIISAIADSVVIVAARFLTIIKGAYAHAAGGLLRVDRLMSHAVSRDGQNHQSDQKQRR